VGIAGDLPRGQIGEQCVVCQIEAERSHGNGPLTDGMNVGARRFFGGRKGTPNPIIGVATGVGSALDMRAVRAFSQTRDLVGQFSSGRGCFLGAWDVDAEEGPLGKWSGSPTGEECGAKLCGSVEIEAGSSAHGHGDGGEAAQRGLNCGSDGTGIEHIGTQVVAVVDS